VPLNFPAPSSSLCSLCPLWLINLLLLSVAAASVPVEREKPVLIVAAGAGGEEEYGTEFKESAALWEKAAKTGEAECVVIGVSTNGTNDLAQFRDALAAQSTNTASELWIVLLGHGTWDGKEARFNFRGPDMTATELAELLKPFNRPLAVINASSCSAPFMKTIAAQKRPAVDKSLVVITATRSGAEENYSRFGKYISRAIGSLDADLDKDGQTSLLEAYLSASREVAEFYESEARLATEHAVLDDNGDGLGTPADWFRGVRATKKPAEGGSIDGPRAHQWHLVRSREEQKLSPEQRLKRDAIELRILEWRERKAKMPEAEYYTELERMLRELSPFIIDSGATNTSRGRVF
jgi:hypothetical protein